MRKIGREGLSRLMPAAGALVLAAGISSDSEAKTPGKSYCFYGKCHRVKTISETEALIGKDEIVAASHYDSCKRDRYNPCGLTSSGAQFDSEAPDNAASPVYPDGTTLLVRSAETGVALVIRVNNAGPYWGDRKLDLSRKAAEVLGFAGEGVARLQVRVIDAPTVEEATYSRNRVYPKVLGYVGQFASLDEAQSGAAMAYVVAGLDSPFPPETVLGANSPVRLAGSAGTQSGPSPVPTVLASTAPASASELKAVAAVALPDAPVKVAALVATKEVASDVVASADVAVARSAKARTYKERTSPRNSRTYRVAQKQKAVREKARAVAVAENRPSATDRKIVTFDGTNDMSVFTRHTYAGMDRIASEEPRRRVSSGYGRSGNDG